MTDAQFLSSSIRPGHPDFLDLPWNVPLSQWADCCKRIERMPRGLSRHPVVFVNYSGVIYALKELPPHLAEKEYDVLRKMEEMNLPVVTSVGHVRTHTSEGNASVLITEFLQSAIPYYSLFMHRNLAHYRDQLLDALAGLLVQVHLSGVYWGDCSLSNVLFRRDAGALQAYFVDAETSEVHPQLSEGMRHHDLEIMKENVHGGLIDLAATTQVQLPPNYSPSRTGAYVVQSYQKLWNEITREEIIAPGKRYMIKDRVQALNDLGFSVDEVELLPTETGERLRMKAIITDRNFHRNQLQNLTGVNAGEMQARKMINEIQELKATLSEIQNRSTPLSAAALYWMENNYTPALEIMKPMIDKKTDLPQLYCQMLEHKWYLSEHAGEDVGHIITAMDFLERFKYRSKEISAPPPEPPPGSLEE